MSVFSQFSIGVSAFRAFRTGLNVAGYNVANASTPGFSRRRIQLETLSPYLQVSGGVSGSGVNVQSMARVRDPFLDFAVRSEYSRMGSEQSRTGVLTALEPMFGDVDTAPLRNTLSALFDSFGAIVTNPESLAGREALIGAARDVAAALRRTDAALVQTQINTDDKVAETVGRINEILEQLKGINVEVTAQEVTGAEASDLRDRRDLLLDELTTLIPARAVESSNGQLSVFIEGTGDTLLSSVIAKPLLLEENSQGLQQIIALRGGERFDLTASLRQGTLGGLLKVRDDDVPNYRTRLNQLSASLITEVNTAHRGGYDLDGNAGLDIFEPDPPGSTSAAAITVNAQVAADPRRIAAADAPGEPGNNKNALLLDAIRDTEIAALDGRTLIAYAADTIAEVGRDTSAAFLSLKASQSIVDALEVRRASVSGVSLDEEAADLQRWQQSFQAAARFMQTANDVIDIAINALGR